jgi:hypothetical protein
VVRHEAPRQLGHRHEVACAGASHKHDVRPVGAWPGGVCAGGYRRHGWIAQASSRPAATAP